MEAQTRRTAGQRQNDQFNFASRVPKNIPWMGAEAMGQAQRAWNGAAASIRANGGSKTVALGGTPFVESAA